MKVVEHPGKDLEPNGLHCNDCDDYLIGDWDPDAECWRDPDHWMQPVRFSPTPLLGDEAADRDFYHHGLKQYVYALEE